MGISEQTATYHASIAKRLAHKQRMGTLIVRENLEAAAFCAATAPFLAVK